MLPLVDIQSISKSYGVRSLFSDVSLGFLADERMGLIGPNGSGKSTLLKILAGVENPDSGEVFRKRGLSLAHVVQEDRFDPEKSVEETLRDSLPKELEEEEKYNRLRELARILEFEKSEQKTGELSGGRRKRLAIAQALIQKPDLLLMDEPTNHLDMDGILWLEKLLKEAPFAFVAVSHDRYFLENIANRVVELNKRYPEGLFKVEGNYSEFIRRREEFIDQQARKESSLSNKTRREAEWLRRGPKARTTKARGRVDKAHKLQEELGEIKKRNAEDKAARIDFNSTLRKTKKLLEAKDLEISRGERSLFKDLDIILSPGKRLGLIGKNGSGKSTLINLLNGVLTPDRGSIKLADNVQIVTFDQKREQLDQKQTLKRALCPAGDGVVYQGRSIHVASWAKRFSFSPEQLLLPVSELSGGEQARVLIANLTLKPADILLLDEPGNDLDIATMEVLEKSLREFSGAVILVTHDRFLLDQLSDAVLYLDGNGKAEFFADYAQWFEARESTAAREKSSVGQERPEKKKTQKMILQQKKELKRIEGKISRAEQKAEELRKRLHATETASDAARLAELYSQLEEAEKDIDLLYLRWEELEESGDILSETR